MVASGAAISISKLAGVAADGAVVHRGLAAADTDATTNDSISEIRRFSTLSLSAIRTGAPAGIFWFSSIRVPMKATWPAGTSVTNRRYPPRPTRDRHDPSPSSSRWPFSVYRTLGVSGSRLGSCWT